MLGTSQEAGESFRLGVYYLLYLATAACAALTAGEAFFPNAFMLSCGKALALAMQGVSYLLVARVLFEGREVILPASCMSGESHRSLDGPKDVWLLSTSAQRNW